MKTIRLAMVATLLCLIATACASASSSVSGPSTGQGTFQATGLNPALSAAIKEPPQDYHLGPFDKISVLVVQYPDLSLGETQIDGSGRIILPQVGAWQVAGKTTEEVGQELTVKLGDCCLTHPQVIVSLREALSQLVTVTGAVKTPNVYPLRGRTTLQQVVAMAGGIDSSTANPKDILVMRTQGGQNMRAKFDLDAINKGMAADPEIVAGDTIVVDTSQAKSIWRGAIQAIPFAGVFTLF